MGLDESSVLFDEPHQAVHPLSFGGTRVEEGSEPEQMRLRRLLMTRGQGSLKRGPHPLAVFPRCGR